MRRGKRVLAQEPATATSEGGSTASDSNTLESNQSPLPAGAPSVAPLAESATEPARPIDQTRGARPPITVAGYSRPPARDVPGIIRAHHDAAEDATADAATRPSVKPLFSNEGLLGRKDEARPRRRTLLILGAGALATLIVALALVGGAGSPGASRPGISQASAAAQLEPSGGSSGSELLLGISGVPDSSSDPGAIAGGSASPGGPAQPGTGPTGSRPPTGGASSSPGMSPGATPSPSASASPTHSPGSTSTASASPTPTPVPTPVSTPVITPPPAFFVSFEPDGSTSGGYVATSTVTLGTKFILFVDTLPGAVCALTEPSHGSLSLGTSPGSTPAFIAQWGRDAPPKPWWPVGTYTVTVTCSLSGQSSVSASKVVQIT